MTDIRVEGSDMADQMVRADRRVPSLRIAAARWRVRQAHRVLRWAEGVLRLAQRTQDRAYEALVDLEMDQAIRDAAQEQR